MKFILTLLLFGLTAWSQTKSITANDKRVLDQILAHFQLAAERPELWRAFLEDLKPFKEKGGVDYIVKFFEPRYQKLLENYGKEFQKSCEKFQTVKFKETQKELSGQIAEAKKVFADVNKESTQKSWDKMSLVLQSILPASSEILAENKNLHNERKKIYEMSSILKYFKEGNFLDLSTFEEFIVMKSVPYADPAARKIMSVNDQAKVPDDIKRGIAHLNVMRLVFGKNVLAIDEKLCACAADHSKDMKEKGFFDHESPVPGKKSPWDRAKNFGTSASGENIAMGSEYAIGSNIQWYLSPGHFKNMFSENIRIGLGNEGVYWTQMLGR